ncbi:MAG TPA: potassium channel family protein [bacterium]|nr:potassium channel family protein [bacterium]
MSKVTENRELRGWAREQAIGARESFRDLKDRILHEPSVRLMVLVGLIAFALGLAVFFIEKRAALSLHPRDPGKWITSFGKAIYWMFISGTTTGYGDITPHTAWGRGLTVLVILSSMILTSVLTATIVSWFVEKRLLEGKGMEKVTWRNHIVICGWNARGKSLLDIIYRDTRDGAQVALVNNLAEAEISELLFQFKRQGLRFVRGDFVHESVLQRANVGFARSVAILADGSIGEGYAKADERTVLCALAVKSMNHAVKVCAELVEEQNVSHLKRAQVDQVVVIGGHDDYLLANAITAPGVTLAVEELLYPWRGSLIQQAKIPLSLVEQDFAALSRHFREKRGALVIGVVSEEERGMSLDDILSEDMSAIDLFIKRQFEGMEEDYFTKGSAMKLRINPPDSYKVQKNDLALLIADQGDKTPGAGA